MSNADYFLYGFILGMLALGLILTMKSFIEAGDSQ